MIRCVFQVVTRWSWDIRILHQTCVIDGTGPFTDALSMYQLRKKASCRVTLVACANTGSVARLLTLSCLRQYPRRVARHKFPTVMLQPMGDDVHFEHFCAHTRATPPQLVKPLHLKHVCAHGGAASPQLVQALLQFIRTLTFGLPNYGKLDATNKA